jgi:hypothetical protein
VTYAGAPAITYFFASSGGRTENVENAFAGAAPEPWLRGVIDQFERGPLHTWSLSLTYARASARLRGLVRGTFEGIEVLKRGNSPRILEAYVLGSGGRTLVSGGELEYRLGLDSTWAYFSSREGQMLEAMPDRSPQSNAAPAPAPAPAQAEAPQGTAGGVQPSGAGEAAPAPASVARSGGTSAPASAVAAYADGTPEQIAWVRRAASKFVSAELRGDGAGACSVLVARLRAPRGGVSCAERWDAVLRKRLHDRRARAALQRDQRAIGGARVEVRSSSATIALPAALLSGHSRFLWTENCWMLTP